MHDSLFQQQPGSPKRVKRQAIQGGLEVDLPGEVFIKNKLEVFDVTVLHPYLFKPIYGTPILPFFLLRLLFLEVGE